MAVALAQAPTHVCLVLQTGRGVAFCVKRAPWKVHAWDCAYLAPGVRLTPWLAIGGNRADGEDKRAVQSAGHPCPGMTRPPGRDGLRFHQVTVGPYPLTKSRR